MKRRGLILVNTYYYREEVTYQIERFTAEFRAYDVDIAVQPCNALLGYMRDGATKLVDFDYDFVIYLDKDKYLGPLLEKAGIRVFNKSLPTQICDEKMDSHLALCDQGIKMPITIPGALCFSASEPDPQLMKMIEETLSYPLIIKESYGSMGKQIKLVKNREEFWEAAKEVMHRPHLFQQYIKSSHGRDIRLMVVGKKVCASMLRQSNGDFRSNLSNGGSGEKVEPSPQFVAMAEKVAEILDLDYCGVDLMFGENQEPIFCEVNSNAFITNIERISGVNVAGKICDVIYREIYESK